MKSLTLTANLVDVLTFGVHPFGLGMRESPRFIRKWLALGDTRSEQMHRGS